MENSFIGGSGGGIGIGIGGGGGGGSGDGSGTNTDSSPGELSSNDPLTGPWTVYAVPPAGDATAAVAAAQKPGREDKIDLRAADVFGLGLCVLELLWVDAADFHNESTRELMRAFAQWYRKDRAAALAEAGAAAGAGAGAGAKDTLGGGGGASSTPAWK